MFLVRLHDGHGDRLTKGLKHIGLELTDMESFMVSVIIGLVVMIVGKMAISRIKEDHKADRSVSLFQRGKSLWRHDDFHRLLHGLCPWFQ